ncbi:MAG: hypothetical protein DRI23_02510 [Candidatus Cloacimonadota bacterium]|nr:MAG: hypothetical protein DRI23_02510 [Candidatus Cloacimonadota bacterium]RLC52915.1 MAG: hypothetical protein DRH79_04335 [Candidatus Cloacimonadota bacterium]
MSQTRFDDLLDIVITDKSSKAKMKNEGISDKDLKHFLNVLLRNEDDRAYHRILADDEKRVISPEAFGYLVHLLIINSIDKNIFEKVISISMQLNLFLKRRINKEMMDEIVNYLIFSGRKEISIKEILDIFFIQENEIEFEEDVN